MTHFVTSFSFLEVLWENFISDPRTPPILALPPPLLPWRGLPVIKNHFYHVISEFWLNGFYTRSCTKSRQIPIPKASRRFCSWPYRVSQIRAAQGYLYLTNSIKIPARDHVIQLFHRWGDIRWTDNLMQQICPRPEMLQAPSLAPDILQLMRGFSASPF